MAESAPIGCAQIRSDGFQRYPRLLHPVDDSLARLVLRAAFTKLNRHLAVPLALKEADTGEIVGGDPKRIRGGNPFPLSDPLGEARAV